MSPTCHYTRWSWLDDAPLLLICCQPSQQGSDEVSLDLAYKLHLACLPGDYSSRPHIARHLGFHEEFGGLAEHWGHQDPEKDQQDYADFPTRIHGAKESLLR